MFQLSQNKEKILKSIENGSIDAADVSFPNLIDTIVLKMKKLDLLESLEKALPDKRPNNRNIPFHLLMTLFVTVKMMFKTSLTDVSFVITDAELLSELGWNMWDNERDLEKGLMDEGTLRNIMNKNSVDEILLTYNTYIKDYVFP